MNCTFYSATLVQPLLPQLALDIGRDSRNSHAFSTPGKAWPQTLVITSANEVMFTSSSSPACNTTSAWCHWLPTASRVVGSGPGRLRQSMTACRSRGRSAPFSSRSSAVVLVVSSNTQKARKSRSALRLHCRPFRRYARIGLDAVPG